MLSEELMTDELRALAFELDALAATDFAEACPVPPEIPGFGHMTLVGRGGMGDVYRARQTSLERDVAVKVLRPRTRADSSDEAHVIAQLHHPNIIHVYAAGETDGASWFAMELADGTNASSRTFSSIDEVARLGVAVAEALVYAHRCGILHRDVKPSNIFLAANGTVKLGDFGLARPASAVRHDGAGTERFMAPELLAGGKPTEATDQYALGKTLRELAGRAGPNVTHTPSKARCHDDFTAICAKATAADPAKRYPDVESMLADLKSFLAREPVKANPPTVFRRVRFFLERNPFAAAGLVSASILLVAFVTALAIGYVRTNRALKSTRRVAREAARSLAVALDAVERGETVLRSPELRRARRLAEALAKRFPEDEKIKRTGDAPEKSRTERQRPNRLRLRRNLGDVPR